MSAGLVELEVGGLLRRFEVAAYPPPPPPPGLTCVDSRPSARWPWCGPPRFIDPASQLVAGSLLAPMPGTVVRVGAKVGNKVKAGQPLLWLEAMKMEHAISAPAAGMLAELPVAAGQQVEVGSVLAVVRPEEDPQ